MLPVDGMPVVEPGPLEMAIIEMEAEPTDQMQPGPRGGTEPGDIPGVRRNLRLPECNMDHPLMDTKTIARFEIEAEVLTGMIEAARAALPNECCGFLAGIKVGDVGRITRLLPLVNDRPTPSTFFTEPRSVLAAFRILREEHLELLAIYHSHPTSAPVPSQFDLRGNTYGPTIAWAIVSLAEATPEVRFWWLDESSYRSIGEIEVCLGEAGVKLRDGRVMIEAVPQHGNLAKACGVEPPGEVG